MNLLFVCTKNKLRSPTAEHYFSQIDGIRALSAGTAKDADTRLTEEIARWADTIFCMEAVHISKIRARLGTALTAKVVCLNIPDRHGYLDEKLIADLERKIRPHLRRKFAERSQ